MKKSHLYILITLFIFNVAAQVPVNMGFKSNADLNNIQEKFRRGVKISRENGTPCLSIEKNANSVKFNSITLEPKSKYKLTLRAYTERPDCIENNNLALEFARNSRGKVFPEYFINCFDKDGKQQNLMLYGKIRINFSAPVISRNAEDYVYVFYTPDNIVETQLELRPNRNKLFVEYFRLEKEDSEGTVNANPDFRYGPLNPCGWAAQTRFFRSPDGKNFAQCGYYNGSPFFLVNENDSYSYYCKGVEAAPGKAAIIVIFFDDKGVKIGTTHLFHGNEVKDGNSRAGLKPPPGTFQAQVVVTNMILSEWRVTKD